jgi:hypothetical protein
MAALWLRLITQPNSCDCERFDELAASKGPTTRDQTGSQQRMFANEPMAFATLR